MLYLTVKLKLTGEFTHINVPVVSVNFGEHMTDVKTLSGQWEILNNLYMSIMLTNEPIRGL